LDRLYADVNEEPFPVSLPGEAAATIVPKQESKWAAYWEEEQDKQAGGAECEAEDDGMYVTVLPDRKRGGGRSGGGGARGGGGGRRIHQVRLPLLITSLPLSSKPSFPRSDVMCFDEHNGNFLTLLHPVCSGREEVAMRSMDNHNLRSTRCSGGVVVVVVAVAEQATSQRSPPLESPPGGSSSNSKTSTNREHSTWETHSGTLLLIRRAKASAEAGLRGVEAAPATKGLHI